MVGQSLSTSELKADQRTVWGLEPVHVHDRFWAARGIQIVRQGESSEIVDNAELFLLTEAPVLVIFKLRHVLETLNWVKPVLLYIRLRDQREQHYRERTVTGQNNQFIRFERIYDNNGPYTTRVALTAHREVALAWQRATGPWSAWRRLRRSIPTAQSTTAAISGSIYDRRVPDEISRFMRKLAETWHEPNATVDGITKLGDEAWRSNNADVDARTRFVGPVWIGAGRQPDADVPIVGPAVLWDDPKARPTIESLKWEGIEPSNVFAKPFQPRKQSGMQVNAKRVFDIVFALIALSLTLPFYPFVMLAIYLEDGRPFFFPHQRETLGGRIFSCFKFRSMRRDAEAVKAYLAGENKADGPQFFIEDDPRLTRVGRTLRRTNIDELPQFINVLWGHMSVVGPRPSPFEENQFCPEWREARLSVRPGITGLWQVKRSRLEGMDFQEWIKYDVEYVENTGWKLDLWIIWKTIPIVLHGILR